MTRESPPPDRISKAGPAWNHALDWLLRIHAAPGDQRLQAERDTWLAEDASHARAYRRAEEIWRIAGAVPSRLLVVELP